MRAVPRLSVLAILLLATDAGADVTAPPRSVGEAVAYVASDDLGLQRIEPSGRHARIGPFKHAHDVVRLADVPSTIFVLDGLFVWRSGPRGERAERISSVLRGGLALYLGGTRGAPWIASHRDVAVWRDGDWTEQLLPDSPNTVGVSRFAVDAGGAAWVKNERGIWRTDGKSWTVVAPPPGQTDVKYCALDGGTAILLGCWETIWRWEGGAWRPQAMVPQQSVDHATLGPDGTLYVAGFSTGRRWLRIVPPSQDEPVVVERRDARTNALVVDGQGRAWIATDRGVEVFTRDGRAVAPRWLREAGDVRGLFVVGDGPKL